MAPNALAFHAGHPLFPRLRRHAAVAAAGSPDIDERDEMLQFMVALEAGDLERGLAMYFHSGLAIWETLRSALVWRFGSLAAVGPLLDFASGYGRVTRRVAAEVPPEKIWVADITREAVAFQRDNFGVEGLVSTSSPADFQCDKTFDAILVCSLFTHLPESTFAPWLERLWSVLRPGGLLLFTVHGFHLLDPSQAPPQSGFLFEPVSESAALDRAEYGSTWVRPDVVRSALARAAPGGSFIGLERGLTNFQDLWIAVKERDVDFSALPLRPGLAGALEGCALDRSARSGRLSIAGWVVDDHRQLPVRELRVSLGGAEIARTAEWTSRPEVQLEHAHVPQGFDLTYELPLERLAPAAILEVVVVDSAGLLTIPYAATLQRALDSSPK